MNVCAFASCRLRSVLVSSRSRAVRSSPRPSSPSARFDSDPWSEPARRLLAEARLAGADRSGALRALDDCAAMLQELGVGPEPATRMLARRIGFARFD